MGTWLLDLSMFYKNKKKKKRKKRKEYIVGTEAFLSWVDIRALMCLSTSGHLIIV